MGMEPGAVLLRFYEETADQKLSLREAARAMGDALCRLLDARQVRFYELHKGRLRPFCPDVRQASPPPRSAAVPVSAEPGEELNQKIVACLTQSADKPVCVCGETADGAQLWLFPLREEDGTACGAVLCTAACAPQEDALRWACRLLHGGAPRLVHLLQAERAAQEAAPGHGRAVDAAMLLHEFKGPLTIVLSALELLERQLQDAARPGGTLPRENLQKYISYAEKNVYETLRFATNLIDAQSDGQNAGVPSLECVHPAQLLAELTEGAQPYARACGASLTFQDDTDGGVLLCSVPHLERIVLNLLSNALKHTPRDGAVAVTLQRDETEWRVRVENDGPQIAPQEFAHLFQKYWRGDGERRGSGLGLYLSQRFAGMMDGRIEAENRAGGGVCFTLYLPLRGRPARHVSGMSMPYRADTRDGLLRAELSGLEDARKR